MALNNTAGVATWTSGATKEASSKKKGLGKISAALTRTLSKKTAATPVKEILFKDAPGSIDTSKPYILIDYPRQNERLYAPVYAIRCGVGGAERVEISIDKGPFKNCRHAAGYWWYDWNAITPGKHTLTARMRTVDGRVFKTPPRSCEYRP